MANKYREDRQEELNKGVDEKEAVKDISEKEYRQYDVQYYYASLKKQDDDGNQVDRTDAEKKELREKFKNIEKDAKDGKDFKKLISDKETELPHRTKYGLLCGIPGRSQSPNVPALPRKTHTPGITGIPRAAGPPVPARAQ